jgi:hypothetical protein
MINDVCLMVPFVVAHARVDGGRDWSSFVEPILLKMSGDFDDIGAATARTIPHRDAGEICIRTPSSWLRVSRQCFNGETRDAS